MFWQNVTKAITYMLQKQIMIVNVEAQQKVQLRWELGIGADPYHQALVMVEIMAFPTPHPPFSLSLPGRILLT